MKLAEALINRADAQKRVQQLRERLNRNIVVQEGDKPKEDPQELLAELDRTVDEMTRLIKQINRTNTLTPFDSTRTLTDALADRDALMLRRNVLMGAIGAASNQNQFRYSQSEIKQIVTIDVATLQKQADDLSRQYRELDSTIQQLNWTIDLDE